MTTTDNDLIFVGQSVAHAPTENQKVKKKKSAARPRDTALLTEIRNLVLAEGLCCRGERAHESWKVLGENVEQNSVLADDMPPSLRHTALVAYCGSLV